LKWKILAETIDHCPELEEQIRFCLIFKKQWTNACRDLINYKEYENERADHYVRHCGCLDSPAGLYST
jgi:hypothetical protein